MRTPFVPRRPSVLFGVAVGFSLFVGCSDGETFFPPLGSAGAGAEGGVGTGGVSGASTAAGAGNVLAGSGGGIVAGSGGDGATGGLASTGGVGGASAGGADNAGAGAGGSPIAGSPGTGGVSEGGQGNETGEAGESAGGGGLGGSAGTGGSTSGTSGASGSAGTSAGSAGQDAGAGGVAGTTGVGGAGTAGVGGGGTAGLGGAGAAGLGGAGAAGGGAGSCGSSERCDGADNDCDGDADEGAVCPVGCGAARYEDHVYLLCDYSVESDYLDYDQATEWCGAAGSALELDRVFELARIESSGENAFVKAWIADTSGVGMIWFGANDLDQERTWVWGRGADAVQFFTGSFQGGGTPYMGRYEDFAAGRPSSTNGLDEDCGAYDSDFAWQWNDLACSRGRRGFVCEERDP